MNQAIQNDFDQHWGINALDSVSGSKLREAEIFFQPVVGLTQAKPIKVLDVGCGDGVHWQYLRNLSKNEQLNYTGVDISALALRHIKKQRGANLDYFAQMDAITIAAPNDTYDLVFAFGVVAYTSNPQLCLRELCRVCKPGGWIGVWIYPKPKILNRLAFNITRQVCQQVGPFWTRRIADVIVPFLGLLPTRSKVNLQNSTWEQCREIVLVNIAPKQLAFYHRDEIASWFAANSINIEYEDQNNPITLWGRKQPAPSR